MWLQAVQALLADNARLAELCHGDQLLAGFRAPDLKTLLAPALENFSCDGFAACEVGAGTGFFAKQARSFLGLKRKDLGHGSRSYILHTETPDKRPASSLSPSFSRSASASWNTT